MASDYLPAWATLDEASAWLTTQTGEPWPLPRLLEQGAMPFAWLKPDSDAFSNVRLMTEVFNNCHHGVLLPFPFSGDIDRLAVDRTAVMSWTDVSDDRVIRYDQPFVFDVKNTQFCDVKLIRFVPPLPVDIQNLRFSRNRLKLLAELVIAPKRVEPRRVEATAAGTASGTLPFVDGSKRYTQKTLEVLCGEKRREYGIRKEFQVHTLKSDGLWLLEKADYPQFSADEWTVMGWHPHGDHHRPALPLPFTVFDFAAFSLAGGGEDFLVLHFESDKPDIPCEEAITRLGPNARVEVQLIRETFALLAYIKTHFGLHKEGVTKEAIEQAAASLLAMNQATDSLRLSDALTASVTREDAIRHADERLLAQARDTALGNDKAQEQVPESDQPGSSRRQTETEKRESRQDGLLSQCEKRGLVFDDMPGRPLPYGVGKAAEALQMTRPNLSGLLKKALKRRYEKRQSGETGGK